MTGLVARCPRCGSSERVEVVAPSPHNPDARFFCEPCVLVFTGSREEAEAEQRHEASKPAAIRDRERTRQGGVEAGVLPERAEVDL